MENTSKKLVCRGIARDYFTELLFYVDENTFEFDTVVFKNFVVKKRIIPKNHIAFIWPFYDHRNSTYSCRFIGILLLNGKIIQVPMVPIYVTAWDISYSAKKRNTSIMTLYRSVIEEVIKADIIGFGGNYLIGVKEDRYLKELYVEEVKEYSARLKEIYHQHKYADNEVDVLPMDEVCQILKNYHIKETIIQWLQNDGVLSKKDGLWNSTYTPLNNKSMDTYDPLLYHHFHVLSIFQNEEKVTKEEIIKYEITYLLGNDGCYYVREYIKRTPLNSPNESKISDLLYSMERYDDKLNVSDWKRKVNKNPKPFPKYGDRPGIRKS